MIQDSISPAYHDARRRRRFAFPNASVLAYALASLEGLACFALLLLAGWLFASDTTIAAEITASAVAGTLYGLLAIKPNHHKLTFPGASRYVAGKAGLALLMAVASAAALNTAFQAGSAGMPPLEWGELALSATFLMLLRLMLYRGVAGLMQAGRLQIERVALVGRPYSLQSFQKQYPVWQRGAQVVATQSIQKSAQVVPDEFVRLCISRSCDSVLFVGEPGDLPDVSSVLSQCRQYALNVVFAPMSDAQENIPKLLDVIPFGPANSIRVFGKPLNDADRAIKRLFDVVVAALLLVVLLPLLLTVALMIKLTSRGPVLYLQDRRGFNGDVFRIIKFRSMSVMEDGSAMTPVTARDPRITRFGHVLRRSSLDELPQLLNVLVGEMSLVGPRPHALSDDAALARRFSLYASRQRIKPGMTGWAQANGYRGDVSSHESAEGRTLHDLFYVDHWSLWFDIKILLLTAFSRRTRQNAR